MRLLNEVSRGQLLLRPKGAASCQLPTLRQPTTTLPLQVVRVLCVLWQQVVPQPPAASDVALVVNKTLPTVDSRGQTDDGQTGQRGSKGAAVGERGGSGGGGHRLQCGICGILQRCWHFARIKMPTYRPLYVSYFKIRAMAKTRQLRLGLQLGPGLSRRPSCRRRRASWARARLG